MLDLTKLCLTLQTVAAITVLFFPQSARVAGVDGEPVRTYLVYDQQRSKLTQLLDGLAIQFRILISAQENEISFLFSTNRESLQVVQSLIDTISQYRSLQATHNSSEDVVNAVLTNVINDACDYLSMKFSGWNDSFNCSESQLTDVRNRISFYTAITETRSRVIAMARGVYGEDLDQDIHYECDYWNSHVLRNCSTYETVHRGSGLGPELEVIQRGIRNIPVYKYGCTGSSRLCEL